MIGHIPRPEVKGMLAPGIPESGLHDSDKIGEGFLALAGRLNGENPHLTRNPTVTSVKVWFRKPSLAQIPPWSLRSEESCPGLPRRYCVQLCMSFIDHARHIPEPYDLFFYTQDGTPN